MRVLATFPAQSASRQRSTTPAAVAERTLPLDDGVGWRLRIDPGVETFEDARLGPQEQDPSAQCGDLLLRDRAGNWTYQFAVTVDDWQQGVDLVIRGMDLLPSTGRQIRLARLLGRERMPRVLPPPADYEIAAIRS